MAEDVMKKRKIRVVRWFAFLCFVLIGIYLSMEPLYTPTAILNSAHNALFPKYIAHKSMVSKTSKANTLEAIQEAVASYVDGIEIDVRFSKDNVPFLYHGDRLEEVTNGSGIPESYTWEQLHYLSYLHDEQSKIITLEEVFKLVGSQKYLFLDIKTSKILDKNFSSRIAELIHKYHLQETVIVESFNPFFLASLRLAARDILLMYDFTVDVTAMGEEVQQQFDRIPWLLKQPFFQKQVRRIIRPDILGPRWNVDSRLLKSLIDHGYPLVCWTVDDTKTAQDLFNMGVKGIQTNKPLELMHSLPKTAQTVYDAGGSESQVEKVIYIKDIQDIIDAFQEAKNTKKTITIAGRRHSMGGQTLLDGSLHLNMMKVNHVHYNPENHTITAGAGATWKKIQSILDSHGRSIKVMQSDNIFTVGGSISANVHGWQVGTPPIASTVLSIKILTTEGKIRTISATSTPELFKAVMGGYGQFGIIVEVELITVPNSALKFHAKFMEPKQFSSKFQEYITNNPDVELAYGRLSVDRNHLFEEVGLFWYEKKKGELSSRLIPESLVAFKRAIFRASQYTEMGKAVRWSAEKIYARKLMSANLVTRNNAMNSDIHVLWPLYGNHKDILQEYFIPKDKVYDFLQALKPLIIIYNMNILNVTLREVRKDTISFLPYANEDVFGLVMLFSQARSAEGERKMREFTKKVINEAIKLGGTFYLPYRLHFTKDQLLASYPAIKEWIRVKKKWDPGMLLGSQFFAYIHALNFER